MRFAFLAVTVVVAGLSTPALAAKKQESGKPGWQACYDLGWIRGVHTEQNELPDWMEQCMAGDIPFGQVAQNVIRRKLSPEQGKQ